VGEIDEPLLVGSLRKRASQHSGSDSNACSRGGLAA
jgi:hypothetical protein